MKKIKILNQEYELRIIPSEYITNTTLAVCHSDRRYIELFEDKPEHLVHELIHAYLNEMGHIYDQEHGIHTENNVLIFEKVLINMIADGHLKNINEVENENS